MPYTDTVRQNRYQLTWWNKRRAAWFAANGPCRHCGSWDDLELDHIDPRGKTSHRVWSWSKERRDAELAKCQPLCARCHRIKTADSQRTPLVHGIRAGYRKGCRCGECRGAAAEYMREWKARRAAQQDAALRSGPRTAGGRHLFGSAS